MIFDMESKQLIEDFEKLPSKLTEQISAKLTQIKNKPPKTLDIDVQALHEFYFDTIDCLDCAKCCKHLGPGVKDTDITRLAKHLRMRPADVVSNYFKIDSDGDYIFKSMPCPFLMNDNYCMVYESRPRACREYPHTDRRRFSQLINITRHNVKTCPAVYYIIRDLKI